MRHQRFHTLTATLLLALAYFATGRLGLMLPAFGSHITLVWLPTGIAVAGLFRFGFGCWPGIAFSSLAVNFATGAVWPVAMGIAVGNTLGPLLAAWVLRRTGFHPAFDRKRDIGLLASAAALGMLLSASGGVAMLSAATLLPEGRLAAWLIWWAGDAMGVIAAAPLVFTITREDGRAIVRRSAEFCVWLCAACAVTWSVFVFNRGSAGGPWALAFVPLPFVAWGTLRFGAAGTSLALIVLSIGAAYGTATGRGPFFRVNPIEGTVVLWIYMATGAVLGWLITALHAVSIHASGIQRLLERALSDVSLGVLIAGLDRRITYVNDGFTRLTGYTEAELLGKSWEILNGPDTDPATAEKLRAALLDGGHFDGEILNYRKDGTSFWNALLISPARDEGGEKTGFFGIQRDITQRKKAELALHRSEEQFRTLADNLPDVVARFDRERRHLYVNRAAESATGLKPEAFTGKTNEELGMPAENTTVWKATLDRVFATGVEERVEFSFPGPNGIAFWESHAVAERGEDGSIESTLVLSRDITAARRAKIEREELERKVQETQKLESLGVLAGGIAHDFNNLLTSILGNASIVAMDLPPGSPVQVCIDQITEASLRAADLCKQMLAYSGRGRFVVEKLDLGHLVGQTAQMLQLSISKKSVLRFQLEKALPPVEADATQLRQVVMNLVINASEAIGIQSGVISLFTGLIRVGHHDLQRTLMGPDLPEGDYVFLEVADNGCGMSAETKARIFDPFFTTKFTGRGLGLAAVLGIVRGHRGAMKVDSEVGRGTTFTLLFPAAAGASVVPAPAPVAAPVWHGEGAVLAVDDEETMRTTVARMMRHIGFEPVLATDGREAVEIFRTNPERFALVLLDLTMPNMGGEQTFAELRRLRPDVRVVLMSGYNAKEALLPFEGKGLASFLQKPFTISELRAVLKIAMG